MARFFLKEARAAFTANTSLTCPQQVRFAPARSRSAGLSEPSLQRPFSWVWTSRGAVSHPCLLCKFEGLGPQCSRHYWRPRKPQMEELLASDQPRSSCVATWEVNSAFQRNMNPLAKRLERQLPRRGRNPPRAGSSLHCVHQEPRAGTLLGPGPKHRK